VILADGTIRVGRALSQRGAHAPPNTGRIGVCLVGDNTVDGRGWTLEQIAKLERYVDAVRLLYPGILVGGHRDVMRGHTACPGLDVRDLVGG
jgi:N-acetyl-anhydromuramyl-L-alanine amidase AmpD